MLAPFLTFSQENQDYYLEINENFDIGIIQTTTNQDETISITTNSNDFSSFINSKFVYEFKKAFPTSVTPRLQRVYVITLYANVQVNDFLNRDDIEKFVLIEEEDILLTESENPIVLPNDFIDPITGVNSPSLELIKAPLAWTITNGDPNILVGVADSSFDFNHYDLQGQIIDNIIIFDNNTPHGTGSAGKIAGLTNNDMGIASLANGVKMIGATCGGSSLNLINGLLELSQYSGVRVVNCSFAIPEGHPSIPYLDDVLVEIQTNNPEVLIVAGAGNGNTETYYFPASYDSTISVSSVGSRFPIGYFHDIEDTGGIYFWDDSWKDCHFRRPFYAEGAHTHNDKVDVTAPGYLVTSITDNYDDYPLGYGIFNGTSGATNFVSALAALVFSVNSSLTPAEVKDIIKTTADDIYYIPYNEPFIGQLGTGRINAYRAVKKAQCMLNPTSGIDLAMQNSETDSFEEPDVDTQYPWQSDDIWVRNQDDGILTKVHQNPEYNLVNPNYVYVRVTNNSCEASTGNDNLKLYWAKANTALSWPLHWEGNLTITDPDTGQDILMGDEIATLSIPSLEIGQEAIIEFEWLIPNPEDYQNINDNPWHFCLLARIDTNNDPMTFIEGEFITQNVLNNNNISWKNTTVVDIIPDIPTIVGGVVAVGNYFNQQKAFSLELVKQENESGKAIYEEAEVTIEMDDILYNAWAEGGEIQQNTDSTKVAIKRIIKGDNALFENIILDPEEIGTLYLTFNFLTKELTNKREFIYHLIQRDATSNEIIGGETFEIRKQPRNTFTANAGNDLGINKNEIITINAGQITEDAVYNWYDPEGNLIYTGTDLTVSPDVTKKYKLEIISNIDGFKDYDEVEITVNPYNLESLVPNPAANQVTISYQTEGASSGYVMVVNTNTGSSDNYILDVQQVSTIIDVSTYPTGLYNIILVCDGVVQSSKTLIKQ